MGRVKKTRRETTLALLYLKHLMLTALSMLLLGVVAVFAFERLISGGAIYYANYAEKEIAAAYDTIQTAEEVTPEIIPELCEYAVFDNEGELLAGDIEKDIDAAWSATDGMTGHKGYYYQSIPRSGEYCVLKYRLITQYRSAALRRLLPPPLTLFVAVFAVIILAVISVEALHFGRLLKKKLQPVIDAAEKVKNQELDFDVEKSDIAEVSQVLGAMDEMRLALKTSLESQWKAERTRKEQIFALAHDLKTPLTVVRGNAELLYDTPLSVEQQECADYISAGSVQMQEYLQQLIDAATSGGKTELHSETVQISDFMGELELQCHALCAVKSLALEWQTDKAVGIISMDKELLKRAFLNILDNAVEHTPAGGAVRVEAYSDVGAFTASVTDTGAGFSPDALKHAKEQFYTGAADRSSKTHYGMGLYTAAAVVERHGGQILLANSQRTGGAVVTVRLPLSDVSEQS